MTKNITNKTSSLTFLRFIAAISIVIFHCGRSSEISHSIFILNLIQSANTAVSFFFLLSGFIMYISNTNVNYDNDINIKKYWIKRFARIYPIYILAFIFHIIVSIITHNFEFNFWSIISSILLIQAWIPKFALDYNYPGWSLSVEVFFYFCFPLIIDTIKKWSIKKNITILSFIWVITQLLNVIMIENLNEGYTNFIHYFPLFHFSTFLAGVVVGKIYISNFEILLLNKIKINILLLILVVAFILTTGFSCGIVKYYHNGLLAPLFSLVILSVSISTNLVTSFFAKKMPVLLGDASYGIYILQIPIINIYYNVTGYIFKLLHLPSVFYTIYAVLFFYTLFCIVMYKKIEKPLNKYLRNYLINLYMAKQVK